ncbi:PREDICTED: butyrophilin-like protein 1 [Chinchilla lanigera]|uniref:butyrophilin-like protein 1 n=1 Tax=Chinchilla lanigera TaxID=34839 RepID=UPI00069742A5|nr:PREDICTED: butyrophilin-like protein 1 [Chinchilla lanigera]
MVDSCRVSPASSLLPLLLLQVATWHSAASEFSVKGQAEPIVVPLGADASLPCRLSPEQSAAHMYIRWYRVRPSPAGLVFQNGQEPVGEQMLEYRGRTELLRDAIGKGSVTLLIRHIRASDDGLYQCHFKDGDVSQEAFVELNVVGVGSEPHVHMTGPKEDGIQVLCSSSGWFPKPKVQWRDTAGRRLPSLPESHTQHKDGLFRVDASLVVTDSSLGNVTCSVQNPLSGQEKISTIFLPAPFFPKVSVWKSALAGTFPILGLLLIGISYMGWREHEDKKKAIKKMKKESHERAQMSDEKEYVLKTKAELEAALEQRKALYNKDWKKALLYPDWRKEHFKPAPVILKHQMTQSNSSDPENKENYREETQELLLSDEQGDCSLITLDQEHAMSERHYWEVDVENAEEWTAGIYEVHKDGTGPSKEPLRVNFRVLVKKGDEYKALAYCSKNVSLEERVSVEKCPQKIMLFLDYGDNDISFYNMTDGTHIFSFTQPTFSGQLYPYFRLRSMELSPSAKR